MKIYSSTPPVSQNLQIKGNLAYAMPAAHISIEDEALTHAFIWEWLDKMEWEEDGPVLKIILDPDKLEIGRFQTSLIFTSDNPEIPDLQVSIAGRIRGPLVVERGKIHLGVLEPGDFVTRYTSVYSVDNHPFNITGFESPSDRLTVTGIKEGCKIRHGLEFHFLPDQSDKSVRFRTILLTDHPEQPKIEIEFEGINKALYDTFLSRNR